MRKRTLSLGILLCFVAPAVAMPLPVIDTPQDTVGPFVHNIIHDLSPEKTALAWLDLDRSQPNTYDPVSGEMRIHLLVFDESSLTRRIGTALYESLPPLDTIRADEYNDFDGSVLGQIHLQVQTLVPSRLERYLQERFGASQHVFDDTGTLYDDRYLPDSKGLFANSTAEETHDGLTFPLYINWDIEAVAEVGVDLVYMLAPGVPGDANGDGLVDDDDLSLQLANWGRDVTSQGGRGWGFGEFDGLAPVGDNDLSLLLANWIHVRRAVWIPEPVAAGAIVLGAVAALRRRRAS